MTVFEQYGCIINGQINNMCRRFRCLSYRLQTSHWRNGIYTAGVVSWVDWQLGMSAESELKLTDIFFPLLVNVLPLPSWVPGTPTVLSAVLSAVFPA
jgi:hypothetical protein